MSFTLAGLALPTSTGAPSPLGRYADMVTAIVSVGVIAAAILAHMGIVGSADAFIDAIALIAVGVLYGTARGVSIGSTATMQALAERGNLNTQLALAAHERLEKIGAPASSNEAIETAPLAAAEHARDDARRI